MCCYICGYTVSTKGTVNNTVVRSCTPFKLDIFLKQNAQREILQSRDKGLEKILLRGVGGQEKRYTKTAWGMEWKERKFEVLVRPK